MSKKRPAREHGGSGSLAAAARALWPAAKGSLARVARPCGRPKECAACRSGRRHPMWIFTFRQKGRLRCRYVPDEWAPIVRRALANGRRLENRIVEEGAALLDRLRRDRAAREGRP
jgi:hypothetical protein